MSGLEDTLIDIPKAPQLIGKIMAHLIRVSAIEFSSLSEILLPLSDSPSEASAVLAEVFLSLKELKMVSHPLVNGFFD